MDEASARDACIKSAMQYMPVAMVLLRKDDLRIEEINDPALAILQISGSVAGKNLLHVIPETQQQSLLTALKELLISKNNGVIKQSEGYLEVSRARIPVQFICQRLDHDEVLLAIYPLKNTGSYQLDPCGDEFATSVIESAGLGTFDFDVVHKHFRSSKRFAEIFGFDRPVPFESYMPRIHPVDQFVRESARQDIKEGRKLFYELRLVMPDQSTKWVRIHAKPFFDDRNQQQRWIGSAQDITIERQAFQQLLESEVRFRTLITETPEVAAALYVGPDIRIQYVNSAMLRFWGKDASVLGKTFMEALPETVDQPFYEQLREVFRTGLTLSAKGERAVLEVDGIRTTRYYNYTYKALRNTSGKIYGIHHMAVDVTDEVNANLQLVQSEESVRQLFMQTPVGIGVLRGESLTIDLVNDSMLAYWKRTREEVIGRPLWEVFPEIASQGFKQITEKVFTTGEPYFSPETPVEMIRNGKMESLYISFAFEPLRDNQGTVNGMLSIGNDVTDLVIARKRSESNEARLQNLADSMPQLVWIADESGQVTYYNNQVKNFGGVTKRGDGNWEWKATVHPDDLSRTQRAWDRAVKEKTKYDIEHRVKMQDGTFRWHLTRAFPQSDVDGNITWYGTATDIQQLKDADMAIRESEERFRIMADATPTIIWALTPEGVHRYLNKFALDYLGITADEVKNLKWDARIHPDDFEAISKALMATIQKKIPYRMEHRLLRHDGQYRWFLAQGGPSYYSDGTLYGFVGSGTDIHEWKLAQEMLKKNEETLENLVKERTLELQRSNDDLQQFAHVASHDLKEPIRKIKTFSYKLQDEFANVLSERGNSLLNKIISSSDRMFAMINGVLGYAAVSSIKTNIEPVDLNKIVKDVENDLELLIAEKNATCDCDDLPTVIANGDLIHQLFYNLINNSLKFSKTNQPAVIKITWKSTTVNETPFAEVTITDNGIGFDNEYAEQIFGTFVRLNSKDQFEGSGLGLALCKRIIERYGGSITADGRKSIGSMFKFTLPL